MKQKGIVITTLLLLAFLFAIVMCNREYDEEEPISKIEQPSDKTSSDLKEDVETNDTIDSQVFPKQNENSHESTAPSNEYPGWDNLEIEKANTAKKCDYLSSIEKQIILYTNLSRLDGKKFSDLYVKRRLDEQPNNSYIKSLIKDLNEVMDLPMLNPNESIFKAAEFHANDLGNTGAFEHESSDGSTPAQRMKRFGYNYSFCGENIYAGQDNALGVVMVLLIDEGIPSVGHRKNILSADFNEIGVAHRPHKSYNYNVVQDFGHK